MAMASSIHLALLALAFISLQHTPALAIKKSYVVYMGTHNHGLDPTDDDYRISTQSHYDILGSVMGSHVKARESVHYSYSKYINGFAASLTDIEVKRLEKSPNVVSVLENRRLKLHTTRSWEFLGLENKGVPTPNSLWNSSHYGENIIIGNLDTGVWPESPSFNDEGLGPIPERWKGACMRGTDRKFKCNKKLIGARFFHKGFEESEGEKLRRSEQTSRDTEGHGSHTLSTAGGNFVNKASIFGSGEGVAKGGSPKARVAAYKVCWPSSSGRGGCLTSDILAAFEAAIGDGVDVLSVSLGGRAVDYKQDGIAIGSFHAMRHGIVVVASAGNSGPEPATVSNLAPWLFTIGASTFDREFINEVKLGGTKQTLEGANLGSKQLPKNRFYPLVDAATAAAKTSSADLAGLCTEGSLDPSKVKGKIVLCRRGTNTRIEKGRVVELAGGVGMIVFNDQEGGSSVTADVHFLPTSHISYKDGLAVQDYIKKNKMPTAHITGVKTMLHHKPAPVMAPFSSRGPSMLYAQILKPDVTAPGVSVMAAFTGAMGPSGIANDTRRVQFSVMSGTSMSCPHVSGIVGLLKSLHPKWSPAAIRSALMTTATTNDNKHRTLADSDGHQGNPFDYGAGHINPNAAADPGLIYDLTEKDYLDYLCATGDYVEVDLKVFSPVRHKCTKSKSILNFNYPSFTVTNFTTSATLTRKLTNVGRPGTYVAKITPPLGLSAKVVPSKLNFNKTGEVQEFTLHLKGTKAAREPKYEFGSLVWTDGKHRVRSPIVVEKV